MSWDQKATLDSDSLICISGCFFFSWKDIFIQKKKLNCIVLVTIPARSTCHTRYRRKVLGFRNGSFDVLSGCTDLWTLSHTRYMGNSSPGCEWWPDASWGHRGIGTSGHIEGTQVFSPASLPSAGCNSFPWSWAPDGSSSHLRRFPWSESFRGPSCCS